MSLFDSHCHLNICEESEPLAAIVGRARDAGVLEMLTVGIEVESSRRALDIAREFAGVYAAVGVHPNDAANFSDADVRALEGMLEHPEVVAVGESGLDFYRDQCPPVLQRAAFSAHIELARLHAVALVIHTRASVDDALEMLETQGPPDALVFHCWSGDTEQVRRALRLGAHVSFAGNVSFRSAQDLRDAAALVPPDRLLIETDSPYLSPVPHRGELNEPARVAHVADAVAAARGAAPEAIADLTSENARRLFGLPA